MSTSVPLDVLNRQQATCKDRVHVPCAITYYDKCCSAPSKRVLFVYRNRCDPIPQHKRLLSWPYFAFISGRGAVHSQILQWDRSQHTVGQQEHILSWLQFMGSLNHILLVRYIFRNSMNEVYRPHWVSQPFPSENIFMTWYPMSWHSILAK